MFSSDLSMEMDVPIDDRALVYDFPCTGEVRVLVIRNALNASSMDHNLIPPFIMRTRGVTINDVPKIHHEDTTVDGHRVSFDQSDLCIPL